MPLSLNLTEWTLQEFLDKIVKNDLGFEEPTVLLDGGTVIWEEGADADSASFEPNLPKRLQALPCGGFQHGTVVTIEDFSQDLTVELSVTHQTVWEKAEDEGDEDTTQEFVIGGTKPVAKAAPVAAATNGDSAKKDEDDDDLIEIVDGPGDGTASKRPAEGGNDEAPPAKKAKTINGDKEIIEIE